MENQTPRRRPPLGLIAALGAIALSAGSATAWFTWRSISLQVPIVEFPELEMEEAAPPVVIETPAPEAVSEPEAPEEAPEVAVDPAPRQETIYWVSTAGTEVALAPTEIALPEGESAAETLTLAFANLMTGPQGVDSEVANSIPEQTELLALTVEPDGVHVDLSENFQFGGGSTSMIGRLAQVVYTATTLDPDAPVWISVGGEPLEVLGGEGLLVRYPTDRGDMAADFGVQPPAN